MRSIVKGLALCALTMGMSACMLAPPSAPPRSALETREMQTRIFPVSDSKAVMKAVLDALQDEGYVTNNAVVDLGLITAVKESDTETPSQAVLSSILLGPDATWEKQAVVEATVNVSAFGKETRVRVSLHHKTLDNRGAVRSIHELDDPLQYQELFAKIDKSVFIQHSGI